MSYIKKRRAVPLEHIIRTYHTNLGTNWTNGWGARWSQVSGPKDPASLPAAAPMHTRSLKFKLAYILWLRPLHTVKNQIPPFFVLTVLFLTFDFLSAMLIPYLSWRNLWNGSQIKKFVQFTMWFVNFAPVCRFVSIKYFKRISFFEWRAGIFCCNENR